MKTSRFPYWAFLVLCSLILQAAILHAFGRPFICMCGVVRLWIGEVASAENSQQITDWYTFTHILHGFILYALLFLGAKRLPVRNRLAVAVLIESSWEILENSQFVIERYRQSALANGYVGDSILNSLSDTLSMMLGFSLAGLSPIWLTVSAGALVEIGLAYAIRDNLTLNIVQLIHPFEFISRWQTGG